MNQYINTKRAEGVFLNRKAYYSEAEIKYQKFLSVVLLCILPVLLCSTVAIMFNKYFVILWIMAGASMLVTLGKKVFSTDKSDIRAEGKFLDATAERYGLDRQDNIELSSYPSFGSVSKFVKNGEIIEALWTVENDRTTPLLIKVISEEVPRDNVKPESKEKADNEFTEIFINKLL